jgi:hypothetical protein
VGRAALTYLLDANVIAYFLASKREDDLKAAATRCSISVADAVYDELTKSPNDGARFRSWFDGSPIRDLPILVDSDVDQTLQKLMPPLTERGRGERASIALAAHDPSLILVTNDRNAMWLAMAELHRPGERMIGVPVFLRRICEQAGCPATAIDAVIGTYPGRVPSWWASWRAALPL